MANNVGVEVRRSTVGPLSFGPDAGDTVCIAVRAEKGPVNKATLITSFDDYEAIFGSGVITVSGASRVADSYYVLKHLFAKGKARKRVWVVRLSEDNIEAASGEVPLQADSQPKPLTINAKSVGYWGNAIAVRWEVVEGQYNQKRLRLDVEHQGKAVEHFDVPLNVLTWPKDISRQSAYIECATGALASGAYDVGDGYMELEGGRDPDPTTDEVIGSMTSAGPTGLQIFRDHRLGRGWLLCPDVRDTEVTQEALEIAEAFYRIVLQGSGGQSIEDTVMGTVQYVPASPYLMIHYPYVVVDDEGNTAPASGLVLASWMDAIIQKGPGKAPAGRDFKIDRVKGLETMPNGAPRVNAAAAEALIEVGVNPLWDPTGEGPRVMGARTRSDDLAWKYAHTIYLYNRIASRVDIALTREVYEIADAVWFAHVRAGIYAELVELHRAGAFDGDIPLLNEEEDPDRHAFFVRVDEDLLSSTERENGIVRAKVWFKEAGVAETILVDIAKRVRG